MYNVLKRMKILIRLCFGGKNPIEIEFWEKGFKKGRGSTKKIVYFQLNFSNWEV